VNIEQATDPQQHIGRPLAQGDQNEILADAHLILGIHQEIVGKRG
jgi:hypothetical protein